MRRGLRKISEWTWIVVAIGMMVVLVATVNATAIDNTPEGADAGRGVVEVVDPVDGVDRVEGVEASVERAAEVRVGASDDAEAEGGDDVTVKRMAVVMKRIVQADAEVLAFEPRAPRMEMSVRAFLKEKLGGRFHERQAWAGRGEVYEPEVLRRRRWEEIGPVRVVTVHHAEGVPNEHPARMIRLIFKGHTNPAGRLDAADVGYHFFVDRDGEVWEGRDAGRMGTHVGSRPNGLNNAGNLGICGLGSFDHEAPPKAMVESIVDLTQLLSEYYGRPLGVRGHKDWVGVNRFFPRGGINCPGKLEGAVRLARQRIESEYQMAKGELERSSERGERRSRTAAAE